MDSERVDSGGIETQLFSWDGWDSDLEYMIHYKPILKVPIGPFPIGTTFDCAFMDYIESKVTFQNFKENGTIKEEFSFILKLSTDQAE